MTRDRQALAFQGLAKSYGKKPVLLDISLSVDQGEFMGLVGANGAGKTTLIKCLLDFCGIDKGAIRIFDVPHTDEFARAPLAFLPEKFMPPYYLTGRDFLAYISRLHGAPYNEARVKSVLESIDLDGAALTKPVRQYSKGMGQKLGLAACFLFDKDLLVMDEPMSGLDPKARACLKRCLLDLKQKGKTLFFSTHLLNDVEMLCDRVVILHEGHVRFTGTTAECCEMYETDDFEQAYLRVISHKPQMTSDK